MDCKNRIIKLRESTGLNRKDFCKLVHIPYPTMTEWELDNRHAPEYVLWLLEYYIRNEGLMVKGRPTGGSSGEYCTMRETLMQRRRVEEAGLRIVTSRCSGRA